MGECALSLAISTGVQRVHEGAEGGRSGREEGGISVLLRMGPTQYATPSSVAWPCPAMMAGSAGKGGRWCWYKSLLDPSTHVHQLHHCCTFDTLCTLPRTCNNATRDTVWGLCAPGTLPGQGHGFLQLTAVLVPFSSPCLFVCRWRGAARSVASALQT